MVDLFLAAHGLLVIGLAAAAVSVAATVLTTRAPGMRMGRVPFFAWSALVAVDRSRCCVLPVAARRADLPVRRPPLRPRAVRRQRRRRLWIGFALTQPATYLFALPAVGIARRAVAGDVPQAHADARRRVRRPRPDRRRRPLRRHPAGRHDLPWAGSGLDLDDFGDKFDDLVPYALFMLLPLLGVVIVMLVGAARRPAAGNPDLGPAEDHAGVRVRLLRRRDGPRRHARRRARADHRPRPAGHGVRGGRRSSTSSTARCSPPSAASPTGARSGRAARSRRAGHRPRPARRAGDDPRRRCRTTSPASPISRRRRASTTTSGPAELWNVLVTAGHVLMLVVVLAFVGLVAASERDGGDPPATTRGAARRWSG